MDKWYLNHEKNDDIVFSVRVRLARNFSGFPFPNKMTDEQKFSVIQKVSDAINNSSVRKEFNFVDINKLSENELYSLVERHIISPDFAKNTKGRALILNENESVSVMINEEDHIRIQSISTGLEFSKAYEKALMIENIIGNAVEYAYDEQFGFLTECPTNLGTGMRASAMVHLPALEKVGALGELFNSIAKMGITVRGMFGEGSKSQGCMYQISNQITLGISETDAIKNIENIINQIIKKETEVRNSFDKLNIEDLVSRAFGTLKYAKLISSKEMLLLLSDVRLGVSMGILNLPISVINELNLTCGSACISSDQSNTLTAIQRDKKRAEIIRNKLESIN